MAVTARLSAGAMAMLLLSLGVAGYALAMYAFGAVTLRPWVPNLIVAEWILKGTG